MLHIHLQKKYYLLIEVLIFLDHYLHKMIVFGGVIKIFLKLINHINTFTRIVRGYQSKQNEFRIAQKIRVICTLFKQPLSNKRIYGRNICRKWRYFRFIWIKLIQLVFLRIYIYENKFSYFSNNLVEFSKKAQFLKKMMNLI